MVRITQPGSGSVRARACGMRTKANADTDAVERHQGGRVDVCVCWELEQQPA